MTSCDHVVRKLRTIVSWDVGICNLAYCILREREGAPPQILEWDSINLLHHETYSCCGKLKKGGACSQKASHVLTTPATKHYLCKRHSKACDHLWSDDHLDRCYTEKTQSSEPCQYTARTGTKCAVKAKYRYQDGTRLCTSHQRLHRKRCGKEYVSRPIPKETVANTSTAELQLRMYRRLDAELMPKILQHGVSEMIIENQPAMKNSGMKAIATSLFAWAVIRGQVDRLGRPGSPGSPGISRIENADDQSGVEDILHVRFVSASNKMKLSIDGEEGTGQDEIDAVQMQEGSTDRTRYKVTKKIGVQHTRTRIEDQPEWITVLDAFRKPDDPCDAYLQGVEYLER